MPRPRRQYDAEGRLYCNTCDSWKAPAEFSPAPTTTGCSSQCRVCKRTAARHRRQAARVARITETALARRRPFF